MKIHDMMQVKIHQYFTTHLALTDEEADKLHREYYKNYGLALEGLVRHHKIGKSC
jgi:pyrimidine and pyridine-specific 5'-nucleotidase